MPQELRRGGLALYHNIAGQGLLNIGQKPAVLGPDQVCRHHRIVPGWWQGLEVGCQDAGGKMLSENCVKKTGQKKSRNFEAWRDLRLGVTTELDLDE